MLLFASTLWLAFGEVCLPDGIPPERRRNFTAYDYNGPIRIYKLLWASAKVGNTIGKTILEEVFGYHADDSLAGWSNGDQIRALSGCKRTSTAKDCMSPENNDILLPWAYVGFEAWKGVGREGVPLSLMPEKVGMLEYMGEEGVYMKPEIADKFYATGRIVTNYMGWNADIYNDFGDHFLTFGEFLNVPYGWNAKNATPLSLLNPVDGMGRITDQYDKEGAFYAAEGTTKYDKFTGESSTDPACYDITTQTLSVVGKGCGQAWVAPYNRPAPLDCIPIVSSSDWGYFLVPMAAKYNWPVCYMSVGYGDWTFVGNTFDVLMYWWTPDVSFKLVKLVELTVPKQDGLAQEKGDFTTHLRSPLELLAWKFLREADGGRGQFIIDFQFNVAWYDNDADMWMDARAKGESEFSAACNWMKQEEKRWRKWLPAMEPPCPIGENLDAASNTCKQCSPGMFASKINRDRIIWDCVTCDPGFAQPLNGSAECNQCLPGSFVSTPGATACNECEVGYAQLSVAQAACNPCLAGTFASTTASKECGTCAKGEYQEKVAQSGCLQCPATFTTKWPGAKKGTDCICAQNAFWNRRDDVCKPCEMLELKCPGGLLPPSVWPDYYGVYDGVMNEDQEAKKGAGNYNRADHANAFGKIAIYACRPDQCLPTPRKPDACSTRREGIACATCQEGYYLHGCRPCAEGNGPFGLLIAIVVLFPFVVWAGCVITSRPYAAKATAAFQLASTFGIMAIFVQMIGMMGSFNITWKLKIFFDFGALFLLDLEGLGIGCLIGNAFAPQFYTSLLLPVIIAAGLGVSLLLSQVITRIGSHNIKLNPNGCFNFLGLVYSALYISLVKMVITYFECMPNPAADRTLSKYKQVVCGSAEHNTGMPAMILGLVFYVIGFFSLCIYINAMAPQRFVDPVFRARFKFLVNRWRVDIWYWGSVAMFRNLCLAMIGVISSTPVDQFIMMGIVMVIFTCGGFSYMPWKDHKLAQFDNTICLIVFFAISCGVGFMHLGEAKKFFARDTSDMAATKREEIESRIVVFQYLLGASLISTGLLFGVLIVYCGWAMKHQVRLGKVEAGKHDVIVDRYALLQKHGHFLRQLKGYLSTGTHYDVRSLTIFVDNMESRLCGDANQDSSSGSRKSKRLRMSEDIGSADNANFKVQVDMSKLPGGVQEEAAMEKAATRSGHEAEV